MGRNPRFQDTRNGSFFGEMAYEQVLRRHRKHFLVVLNDLIDWDAVSLEFTPHSKGEGTRGRPPYEPKVLLKMLFLSYLYNISERSIEEFVDTNLLAKWFMGLPMDEQAPDHATLTVFRRRLEKARGSSGMERLFDQVILAAKEHGLTFGELQVLDSVHTQADLSNPEEDTRHDSADNPIAR